MNSVESHPTISIIIAVLNGARNIERCINNILSQTYLRIELIICDGGSTDGTPTIIKNHESDILFWEAKKDNGIYHAWNKGLDHTRGEWILFRGVDDLFYSDSVIEELIPVFLENSKRNAVYGKMLIKGGLYDNQLQGVPWSWKKFQKRSAITHPTLFHNRKLFEVVGKFDESYKIAGDYELLLRIKDKLQPVFVNKIITIMDQTNSISSLGYVRSLKESKRAQMKNKVRTSIMIHIWYVVYRLFKLFPILERAIVQNPRFAAKISNDLKPDCFY